MGCWIKTFYQGAVVTILVIMLVVFLELLGIKVFPKPILAFEAIFSLYGFAVFGIIILFHWKGSDEK